MREAEQGGRRGEDEAVHDDAVGAVADGLQQAIASADAELGHRHLRPY